MVGPRVRVLAFTCSPRNVLSSELQGAGIVLTNDGNAILREIDVSHPAAKVCGLDVARCASIVHALYEFH